jgi:hypothetical protein
MCTHLSNKYHVEDKAILSCSVTGDEMWIQYYMPDSKCESIEWKQTSVWRADLIYRWVQNDWVAWDRCECDVRLRRRLSFSLCTYAAVFQA